METILDKAIGWAEDNETKNNINKLKGFYKKIQQFVERENIIENEENQIQKKTLDDIKKKELILQISTAVEEGKELDAKIAEAKDITKEK